MDANLKCLALVTGKNMGDLIIEAIDALLRNNGLEPDKAPKIDIKYEDDNQKK